ncbi:putative phosphate starvation-inducible protein PhoH [Ralstonia phage RP31]|uniref:PhoH-like protein n=2 Tax=Ripduovirus RP12 TaxID=2560700 RepID=A0A1L7N0N6_9CAUD|nr:PhoH-like phosphate starvation-inducible [Ralstonia phage RP12]BAW19031.1 putative phosphate starvation-inducible protein PhoH [Ralstonia phage RP12]BAW19316.1 putative phosphate starvation-inducible protein PhoH [Ralstonia phage RP31]
MRDTNVKTKSKRARQAADQRFLHDAQLDAEAREEYRSNKPIFGPLTARNPKQQRIIDNLDNEAIRLLFLIGPAGTGKTFVPTSYAAEQLLKGEIERIIITRPMVGCDEDMGFLPGTEEEKFEAWISPFIEVLEGKLGKQKVKSYRERGLIVAKPLMRMRGSTFRNAIVILDEAQNTTPGQMKMFLTRAGQGSRLIINGDADQSDLPKHKENGLDEAVELFRNSHVASFHEFDESEITRDPLVREVVKAYRRKYAKAA